MFGAQVLEAIQSGLAKYVDVSTIQKALLRQSTEPVPVNGRKDLEHYLSEGYVSVEADDKAAVLTLTNAFDDYLLAGISQHVGDTAAARQAQLRSYNYRNVWSRKRQFVCPKSVSGNFSCPRTAVGVRSCAVAVASSYCLCVWLSLICDGASGRQLHLLHISHAHVCHDGFV